MGNKIAEIPDYDAQFDVEDPIAYERWYNPVTGWQWFVFGLDKEAQVYSGYVKGIFDECGDFTIQDMYPMAFKDDEFEPMPFSKIDEKYPNTNNL